jgi:hypothetical protein
MPYFSTSRLLTNPLSAQSYYINRTAIIKNFFLVEYEQCIIFYTFIFACPYIQQNTAISGREINIMLLFAGDREDKLN